MNDLTEKDRRLAEWESTCTGMLVEGSRRAWRFFLLDEVNKLLNEQLSIPAKQKQCANVLSWPTPRIHSPN